MSNPVCEEFEELFQKYDDFINMYEHFKKTSKTEEILDAFKFSFSIEKITTNFIEKSMFDSFLEALCLWHKNQGKYICYNSQLYASACDYLFLKIFRTCSNIECCDVAIRIYTSMIQRERFENLLEKFILDTKSCEAISDFTLLNSPNKLSNNLLLSIWSKAYSRGFKSDLQDILNYKLNDDDVISKIPKQLAILSIQTDIPSEIAIKNMILEGIQLNMKNRNELSENFWYALLKHTKLDDLIQICKQYFSFLEGLLDFILYIGSRMSFKCVIDQYIYNNEAEINLYSKITSDDIIKILKGLVSSSETIKTYVNKQIKNVQTETGCKLWSIYCSF